MEASAAPKEMENVPDFQDIHIERIVCRGCKTGIKAAGIEGMSCIHDIDISNSSIIYNKVATAVEESTAKLTQKNVRLTENKKAE
jgi:peptide deformylase